MKGIAPNLESKATFNKFIFKPGDNEQLNNIWLFKKFDRLITEDYFFKNVLCLFSAAPPSASSLPVCFGCFFQCFGNRYIHGSQQSIALILGYDNSLFTIFCELNTFIV